MKLQLVSMMVICLAMAQGVVAGEAEQDKAWNRYQGFYAEAGVGTGWDLWGVEKEPADNPFDPFAWVVALGYSFTANHAIELGFGQWPDVDFEDVDNTTYSFGGGSVITHRELEYVSGAFNLGYLAWRGTVPFQDRWAFFGKVGLMVMNVPGGENDGTQVGLFTGLGVSYAVTRHIDLGVQSQGGLSAEAYAGMLTFGAGYHF